MYLNSYPCTYESIPFRQYKLATDFCEFKAKNVIR